MRLGCGGRRGRGRQWSASSGICCVCNRYPPEELKLGTHIAIRWSIWAEPQKTPFDPFWRYISPKPWCKSLLFPSKVLTPLTIPQFPVWRVWPVGKLSLVKVIKSTLNHKSTSKMPIVKPCFSPRSCFKTLQHLEFCRPERKPIDDRTNSRTGEWRRKRKPQDPLNL